MTLETRFRQALGMMMLILVGALLNWSGGERGREEVAEGGGPIRPLGEGQIGGREPDGRAGVGGERVDSTTDRREFLGEGMGRDGGAEIQPGMDGNGAGDKGQKSLWAAFSEARRAIVELTSQEKSMERNRGVRYFAQNPAQRIMARFLADRVRIESGRCNSAWLVSFTAPSLSAATAVSATDTRVEYTRGKVVEWYDNRREGLEHGFILREQITDAQRTRIPVGIEGLRTAWELARPEGVPLCDALGRPRLSYEKLVAWDATGKLLPAHMEPHPNGIDLVVDTNGAAYPVTIDPLIVSLEQDLGPLLSGEGQDDDEFGGAVALSGETALIGSETADSAMGPSTGAAYLFRRHGAVWVQEARLSGENPGSQNRFGSAVALEGNQALVGASGRRSAFVFVRKGGEWRQEAELVASDGHFGDRFGDAVAISEDLALTGAPAHDGTANESGSAFIFRRLGEGIWQEEQALAPGDLGEAAFFGTSVSIVGETAAVGANRANGGGDESGAVYVYGHDDTEWTLQRKIAPEDAARRDNFGISVSLSGERLLVGANLVDEEGSDSGSAYVFRREGTEWSQEAKLTASDGERADRFGSAVSLDGDRALVGAPWSEVGRAGSAYVFLRNGSHWTEGAKLVGSDGEPDALLGGAVSLSGETALVGAGGAFSAVRDIKGSAYVYDLINAEQWVETAKIVRGDGGEGDRIGAALSLDGDRAVIGAPYDDTPAGASAGSAYVLVRAGELWGIEARLRAEDGGDQNLFGISVSLDGDNLLIGAPWHEVNPSILDSGSAYLFSRQDGRWVQGAKLVQDDIERFDYFGGSVSLDGNLALIGSSGDRVGQGSAYLFSGTGSRWSQEAKLVDPEGRMDDGFGARVGLSGTTVAIGSPGADDKGNQSGSVFIYGRNRTRQWILEMEVTASDGNEFGRFGSAVDFSGDRLVVGAPRVRAFEPLPGSAYIFQRSGRTWREEAKLSADDEIPENEFGAAVAIDGDRVVIGAPGDGSPSTGPLHEAGSAYFFERVGETWEQDPKLISSHRGRLFQYGSAVSLEGDTLMIGADREDSQTPLGGLLDQQGSVYVYRIMPGNSAPSLGELTLQVRSGVSSEINLAKLLRHAMDPDGDPLEIVGVDSITAQNGRASLERGRIIYTPAEGFTGTDQIGVTISDGSVTVSGSINFTVTDSSSGGTNNAARFTLLPGGALRVSFAGVPGLGYGVERSEDMREWRQIASATADGKGRVVIEDADPPVPAALYRLVYPSQSVE